MRFGIGLKWHFLAILLLLLAPRYMSADNAGDSTHQQAAESAAPTSRAQLQIPSGREGAGLRGPVKECSRESTYGQGNWKMIYATQYGLDGRTLRQTYTNNDGTKGTETFTYDADGHLLRTVWTEQAKGSDTIYDYDSQGRLVGITGQGDWTTTFEYDAQGRKTRIVKSTLSASSTSTRPTAGISIERENVDLFAAPPPGGWVTTSFNERDQPIESRVYGSTGTLISRLTRSYDAKGRVTESAYAIEDAESLLAPSMREQFASDPQVYEEMESQFAKFLGPQRIFARVSYTYDSQGRVKEEDLQVGPSDRTVTKTSYNDHGDEAQEIQITSHGTQPDQKDVVNFSYQYDGSGNWTEKTASSAPTANKPSKIWTIDRRTITYY